MILWIDGVDVLASKRLSGADAVHGVEQTGTNHPSRQT